MTRLDLVCETEAGADRWAPVSIDVTNPSTARMCAYYLGGKDYFAVDRAAADELAGRFCDMPRLVRQNREVMRRVILVIVDAGVRKFIEIGSGLPAWDRLVTHLTDAGLEAADVEAVVDIHRPDGPLVLRSRSRVAEFFTGWELLEPGLVPACGWRPKGAVDRITCPRLLADVGRRSA